MVRDAHRSGTEISAKGYDPLVWVKVHLRPTAYSLVCVDSRQLDKKKHHDVTKNRMHGRRGFKCRPYMKADLHMSCVVA